MSKNWLRSAMIFYSSILEYIWVGVYSHSVRKWSPLKKVNYKISDTQFAFYYKVYTDFEILEVKVSIIFSGI